jgi:hypothetical protein
MADHGAATGEVTIKRKEIPKGFSKGVDKY